MKDAEEGYKQTINYHLKEKGRKNKKRITLRLTPEIVKVLEEYRWRNDFQGSDQKIIDIMIHKRMEQLVIEEWCKEDPTMINLIKQAKRAEKIHNSLIDGGFNPDQRRVVIKLVKDEKMRERLDKLEDEYQRQRRISLKRRGRLNR